MGLSVYGTVNKGDVLRKGPLAPGDLIILTKPIGTGVLMAADMRGDSSYY
jgi:selenide,water dikinase